MKQAPSVSPQVLFRKLSMLSDYVRVQLLSDYVRLRALCFGAHASAT
jgi:hypothetical protein